jgi:hypothetical protein
LHSLALVIATFAYSFAFSMIRYRDIPALLRPFIIGIGGIVFIQVLFDATSTIQSVPNLLFGSGPHVLFFRYGAVLALGAGIASFWRPSFLLPVFFFYVSFRVLIGSASGINIVDTDYLSMLDCGEFTLIGGTITAFLTSSWAAEHLPWLRPTLGIRDAETLRRRACGLIWACAVGAHLGNYWMSALAKLDAGGAAPWTWLLHNATQTSIVIGLERGDNPLATWPWAVQAVWDGISHNLAIFNSFVLGAQLLSPLAPLTVRSLMVFTLLFDVFHIGVYLTLGAAFFFWVAVNTIILVSAGRLRKGEYTLLMKAIAVVTVVFGHYAFYTNHLGWLDGAKLASPNFYAETRDGHTIWVPSNYFGINSYTIAQGGMYIPDNNFSFRIGGNNLDPVAWKDAITCGPATVPHQDTGVSLDSVDRMVRDTHRFMKEYPVAKELNLYYFYPHHMVPNPGLFTEFNNLSIDDIVGYKYVVESVCLGVKDGKLTRDVKKRWEHQINVP